MTTATLLGLGLVPFVLETSCYYAAGLCVFALVAHDRDRLKLPLLGTLLALLVAKWTIPTLVVNMAIGAIIGTRSSGRAPPVMCSR